VVMVRALALLILVLAARPAAAQDRLDAVAGGVDRAITPAAEPAAVERMAKFLGTTSDALRAERAGTRLGWGDLFISHRIASRGGHPVEKVFAARRTGAPWGEIASDARVEPDALVQDVATLWPDAARATPGGVAPPDPAPVTTPGEKKGVGARVLDLLRGSPPDAPPPAADDRPADRTQEEIRDRMIRGGGRSR